MIRVSHFHAFDLGNTQLKMVIVTAGWSAASDAWHKVYLQLTSLMADNLTLCSWSC